MSDFFVSVGVGVEQDSRERKMAASTRRLLDLFPLFRRQFAPKTANLILNDDR